ncbi:MAG: helix-turn-helix transcriptional regulator [Armatimonadia bacterium]
MKCPHCNGTGTLAGAQVTAGALILLARKERGLTQADLAQLVGMSRTQITNIEVGRSDMPLKTLARFAEALNVSMKDLVP